jgi:hypothetical protein
MIGYGKDWSRTGAGRENLLIYTSALGRGHVKAAKERLLQQDSRRRAGAPRMPKPEQIALKVDETVAELQVSDAIPESAKKVWEHVEATLSKPNAERGLKYLFYRQQARAERVFAMEENLKMTLPYGNKEFDLLRAVCEAMLKLEVAYEWARGHRGEMPCSPETRLGWQKRWHNWTRSIAT